MIDKKQHAGAPIKALLGHKPSMTQMWGAGGHLMPPTVVQVGTNVVTQVRADEVDDYPAIQPGFGEIDSRKVTRPLRGHFEKIGAVPRRHLIEVRMSEQDSFELGQELDATTSEAGEGVDVSGTIKGKGFTGVMKRHGSVGVPVSHGVHRDHRRPGPIGACATPDRIFKGLRIAGRVGGNRRTVQDLTIQVADAEKGLLPISGAIPSSENGMILVRSSVKGAR